MDKKDEDKLSDFLYEFSHAQDSLTHYTEKGPGGWRRASVARKRRNEIRVCIVDFVKSLVEHDD